jgi:hypothetical protein
MTQSRMFSLGAILSITDGHLVAPNLMDDVYDIVGFLIGDRGITTIGLLAVHAPCKRALLEQHPQLAEVAAQDGMTPDVIERWMRVQVAKYGAELPVSPMEHPPAPRTVADDILDVMRINPNAEIIAVEP